MQIRVAAYAVITDDDGRVLLAHWTAPGHDAWTMPGGGLEPGEDPACAAVREVEEETGYQVELGRLLGVDSVVIPAEDRLPPAPAEPLQGIRIVYSAEIVGGVLRAEVDGSTDEARWFAPAEIPALTRVELVDIALAYPR